MPLSSYYKQYDDINKAELERQKEVYKQLAETQKAQANQNADYAIKKIEDAADVQIKEAQSAYDGVIRTANVQRLIDERKVSERMANLGMTDSGLNRTQQTAVQLNRTNAINKAELARQKQIDALALEVTRQVGDINIQRQNTLTELDTQNQANLLGLEENYNANRNAWATGAYKADQSAAASRYKAKLDYDAKIAKEAEANEIKRLEDKEKLIEKLKDPKLSMEQKEALAQKYYNQWGNDYEIHGKLDTLYTVVNRNGKTTREPLEKIKYTNSARINQIINDLGDNLNNTSDRSKRVIISRIEEALEDERLTRDEAIYLLQYYGITEDLL